MDNEVYNDNQRQKDYDAIMKTLRYVTEGVVVVCDIDMAMEYIAEDVKGLALGEQGTYYGRPALYELFLAGVKSPIGTNRYATYDNVDISISSPVTANLKADVCLHLTIEGQEITSSYVQTAALRKENGKWMWYVIFAAPLGLTKDSIEAMPFKFADAALAALKGELQTDTFDLMNQSFSGGIMGTYMQENYPLYFANDALIQMLGYERAEFEEVFKDNTVKLNYSDDKEHMVNVSGAGEQGTEDFGTRVRWHKKDGSLIWVEMRTRKTTDDDGNGILLSVVMDITEIVELQMKTKEQNQTIMDSIDYASKIQKNLLPMDSVLENAFSDYSVLWKPRDIVGGDIYWVKSFDEGTVLCVCDCTGHGTPGALLTMLVVSAFEAAINKINYKDTAEIIWQLERRLVSIFNVDARTEKTDDSTDIKDGCDLAVLYISKDGSVTISAGHTNVFICDGKEVSQIKGQKIYVGEGKISSKKDIVTVTILANPADKFYISSDGLFDQMGESRRKFGYKIFKQIILENHNEKQAVVSDKIWEAFESHRGGQIRRDDVELITFKI